MLAFSHSDVRIMCEKVAIAWDRPTFFRSCIPYFHAHIIVAQYNILTLSL